MMDTLPSSCYMLTPLTCLIIQQILNEVILMNPLVQTIVLSTIVATASSIAMIPVYIASYLF